MARVIVGPCEPCGCGGQTPGGVSCCNRTVTGLNISCGGNVDFSCSVCSDCHGQGSASSFTFLGASGVNGGYTLGFNTTDFPGFMYRQWLGTRGSLTDPGKPFARIFYGFKTTVVYAYACAANFQCNDYFDQNGWNASRFNGGFALQIIDTFGDGSQFIGEGGLSYACYSHTGPGGSCVQGGSGFIGCFAFAGATAVGARVCDGAPMYAESLCQPDNPPGVCGVTYTSTCTGSI